MDGSFVTAKSDPDDIDVIVVLPADHDFTKSLRPFEYNVLSRRQVRKRYGIDLLLTAEGRPEFDEYVAFFAQVLGVLGLEKVLLKVAL